MTAAGLGASRAEGEPLHPVQSAFLERDGLQCGYVEVVDQVASSAEEEDIDAEWLDEEDTLATSMGSRGIGE